MNDLQQLFDQLFPVVRQTLLRAGEEELSDLRESLQAFRDCLLGFRSREDRSGSEEKLIRDLLVWVHASIERRKQVQFENDPDGWLKGLDSFLETLPDQISLPLTLADLEPIPESSVRLSIWQRWMRISWQTSNGWRNLLNHFRRWAKKEALPHSTRVRTFLLRPFTAAHSEPIVGRALLALWEKRQLLYDDTFTILLNAAIEGSESESVQEAVDFFPIERLAKGIDLAEKAIDAYRSTLEKAEQEVIESLEQEFDRAWKYAGTWVYPPSRFSEAVRFTYREKAARNATRLSDDWNDFFVFERDNAVKDLELLLLRLRALEKASAVRNSLQERITGLTQPTIRAALEAVSGSLERVKAGDADDAASLTRLLQHEGHDLQNLLRNQHLPAMTDSVIAARADALIQEGVSFIRSCVDDLSPVHRIILDREEGTRPRIRVEEVALGSIVARELFPELVRGRKTILEEADTALQDILQQISEVDQVVEFNLEAALNLMQGSQEEDVSEEAHRAAIEGMERAEAQLESLVSAVREYADQLGDSFSKEVREFGDQLITLADNRKIADLKLRLARAAARDHLRIALRKWTRRILRLLPSLASIGKQILEWFARRYWRIRSISGLVDETGTRETVERFLRETQASIDVLPIVYRRLFRLDPLTDERFFAGRDEEIERLANQVNLWKSGYVGNTALVGEKGSGRTSLLIMVQRELLAELPHTTLHLSRETKTEKAFCRQFSEHLKLTPCETFASLGSALETHPPTVLILEDLQNLFVRHIHGFDLIERLLLLMTHLGGRHLWMITCSQYAWSYLERVLSVDRYFNHVVRLTAFSLETLSEILFKRHRVSGYRLRFEVPDSVAQSKKFMKLLEEEQQEYLQGRFLDRINAIASGNISVALLLWMRVVKPGDGSELLVETGFDFDPAFLNRLPVDELFTLATLILHEGLGVEEHALVFHQEEEASRMILGRIANRGMVQHDQGIYRVHPFLYRPVVHVLRSRNMIL